MSNDDLEKVILSRVRPMIDEAMHRCLGITVAEINTDITDKILKSPLFLFEVDTNLPLRKAKESFRRYYLTKVLKRHFGNVSEAAKTCCMERRSLHRLINQLGIDVTLFRREMQKHSYLSMNDVQGIIERTLAGYKQVIQPERLRAMYDVVPKLSEDITHELPATIMTMKDAEDCFEKEYIQRALEKVNFSITKAAKNLGMRYETLHRKMKSLGISLDRKV